MIAHLLTKKNYTNISYSYISTWTLDNGRVHTRINWNSSLFSECVGLMIEFKVSINIQSNEGSNLQGYTFDINDIAVTSFSVVVNQITQSTKNYFYTITATIPNNYIGMYAFLDVNMGDYSRTPNIISATATITGDIIGWQPFVNASPSQVYLKKSGAAVGWHSGQYLYCLSKNNSGQVGWSLQNFNMYYRTLASSAVGKGYSLTEIYNGHSDFGNRPFFTVELQGAGGGGGGGSSGPFEYKYGGQGGGSGGYALVFVEILQPNDNMFLNFKAGAGGGGGTSNNGNSSGTDGSGGATTWIAVGTSKKTTYENATSNEYSQGYLDCYGGGGGHGGNQPRDEYSNGGTFYQGGTWSNGLNAGSVWSNDYVRITIIVTLSGVMGQGWEQDGDGTPSVAYNVKYTNNYTGTLTIGGKSGGWGHGDSDSGGGGGASYLAAGGEGATSSKGSHPNISGSTGSMGSGGGGGDGRNTYNGKNGGNGVIKIHYLG
jgi:hypothetical protein